MKEALKHLDKIGEKNHSYVLHGNIDQLCKRVDQLVDAVNDIYKILHTSNPVLNTKQRKNKS